MIGGSMDDDSRPSSGDVYSMWRGLDIVAQVVDVPAVDAYLEAFELECGARTARGCLELAGHPMIEEYFDRLDYLEFGRMLLASTAADSALPEVLADATGAAGRRDEIRWDEISRFVVAGLLAQHLNDGAGCPDGQAARHLALGTSLITELIDDRYDDLAVWFTGDVWSPWFRDSGWSAVWLIADRATHRVHILCIAHDLN